MTHFQNFVANTRLAGTIAVGQGLPPFLRAAVAFAGRFRGIDAGVIAGPLNNLSTRYMRIGK